MKTILFSLVVFLSLTGYLPAQDKFDELTTTSGKTYKDVTVKGKGALGISIKHAGGLANISFRDLSDELRKKYGYDPKKEQAAGKQRAETMAAKRAQKAAAAKLKELEKSAKKQTYKIMQVTKKGLLARKFYKGGVSTNGGIGARVVPSKTGSTIYMLKSDPLPSVADGEFVTALVVEDGVTQYTTVTGSVSTVKVMLMVKWEKGFPASPKK